MRAHPADTGLSLEDRLTPPLPSDDDAVLTNGHLPADYVVRDRPSAYVVHDPDRHGAVTAAALRAAAHPARDVVVCQTSPGSRHAEDFWVDLLVALGKTRAWVIDTARSRRVPRGIAELGPLWLRAWAPTDLIVLRPELPDDGFADAVTRALRPHTSRVWWVTSRAPSRSRQATAAAPTRQAHQAHQAQQDQPVEALRRRAGPHPVSPATFVAHWGCPHRPLPDHLRPPDDRDDRDGGSGGAGQRPVLLPQLRLFTLTHDLARHCPPGDLPTWDTALRTDLADARAALARLLVPDARRPSDVGRRRHHDDTTRNAAPDASRLADATVLAAGFSRYLDLGPDATDLRYTLRWRALQLALLERSWYLTEDRPPTGHPARAPVTRLPAAWTAAVNQLVDPVDAGHLALASALGLTATQLARLTPSDLPSHGHHIVVDGIVWPVPDAAAPLVRALAAAWQRPPSVDWLPRQLADDAARVGLPPPTACLPAGLPGSDRVGRPASAASEARPESNWWDRHGCHLTPVPVVTVAAPDPVHVALRFAEHGDDAGMPARERH